MTDRPTDHRHDDSAARAMAVRLLDAYRAERQAAAAHSLRGKHCPIQRPGLKR